jgi:hypothetical protein
MFVLTFYKNVKRLYSLLPTRLKKEREFNEPKFKVIEAKDN